MDDRGDCNNSMHFVQSNYLLGGGGGLKPVLQGPDLTFRSSSGSEHTEHLLSCSKAIISALVPIG